MNSQWLTWMFLSALGGSVASLFWPLLIALWRKQSSEVSEALGLKGTIGARAEEGQAVPGPWIFRFGYRVLEFVLLPFARYASKALLFLLVALLIALVSTAVGFAAFLQNEQTLKSLEATGLLSYFSAFNYGFTAAALVSEPLKNKSVKS
jgi:hypothetical protein